MVRRKSVAGVGALAACLLGISMMVAQASPAPEQIADEPVQADRNELSLEVASALAKVLAVAADEPGLGGERFVRDDGIYIAYLVGEPSTKLREVAAEVDDDLDVQFAKAVATKTQLDEATEELGQIDGVAGIFREPDGSGLRVDFVGSRLPAESDRAAARSDQGVPVNWNLVDQVPYKYSDTRPDDSAPFNGGSRIKVQNGGGCSMGLPVKRKSNGAIGMLTAAHCIDWGTTGREIRTYIGNRLVGTSRDHTAKRWDAQFVRGNSTSYGTSIFTGGHLAGTKRALHPEYRRYVAGDRLRISGGYSGNNLGDITGTYTPTYGPSGVSMGQFYLVASVDNTGIAGDGDSGAPSFELYAGSAVPAGIHSGSFGGSYERACKGVPTGKTRKCSSLAMVSPWCNIRTALNVEAYVPAGSYGVVMQPGWVKC